MKYHHVLDNHVLSASFLNQPATYPTSLPVQQHTSSISSSNSSTSTSILNQSPSRLESFPPGSCSLLYKSGDLLYTTSELVLALSSGQREKGSKVLGD